MNQPRGYFHCKTVAELSRQVRNKEVSCLQLAQESLNAISRLNPTFNAFVSIHAEEALSTARLLDQELAVGKYRGPLHGIPIAIKDNIDTGGTPTTYGSHLFQNHEPEADADCVALLREAGAVVVGKTLTSEFALGPTGEFSFQGGARNPYDPSRVTGGSSAGSAAAVGAGLVPISIGTDTAGSIRIPASFCGVVGFKPSHGRVSVSGVYPVSATLDHVGSFAQTVEDIVTVMDALGLPSIKVGVIDAPRVAWIDPAPFITPDDQVLERCTTRYRELFKQRCKPVELGQLIPQVQAALKTILLAEAYAVHSNYLQDENSIFSAELKDRLGHGEAIRAWQYLNALEHRRSLQAQFAELFESVDLLVMPSTAVVAPSFGLKVVDINGVAHPIREAINGLTSPWNLLGLPAISIPAGIVRGLPCGLQIIAGPNHDEKLLSWLADLKV